MMKITGLWLLPALALVAGCSSQEEEKPAPAEKLTFHEVMKDKVDLRADVVWAIGNAAIGDKAGIDPAQMSDEEWTKLAEAATSLEEAALEIAKMDPIVLNRPGVKIADEGIPGGHSSAVVQARFDKEPQKLRDMANVLAVHVGDLATAARAHDAERAGLLVDQLDGVCESCHLEFWYPDQKEMVEKILGKQA